MIRVIFVGMLISVLAPSVNAEITVMAASSSNLLGGEKGAKVAVMAACNQCSENVSTFLGGRGYQIANKADADIGLEINRFDLVIKGEAGQVKKVNLADLDQVSNLKTVAIPAHDMKPPVVSAKQGRVRGLLDIDSGVASSAGGGVVGFVVGMVGGLIGGVADRIALSKSEVSLADQPGTVVFVGSVTNLRETDPKPVVIAMTVASSEAEYPVKLFDAAAMRVVAYIENGLMGYDTAQVALDAATAGVQ